MYIFRESEFSCVLHLSVRSICIFCQLPAAMLTPAVVSSATVGGCSVSGATKAQRSWRTARRRQRGGSSAEAAADSPAPSANGPTQVPSNATDSPTYASSSLVEDGGTTASTASSSSPRRRRPWRRPLQSPMRRRCR